jgi:glucose/mannose transport system permease protein
VKGIRRWGPGLLLVSPSIVLVAVFVYGLIGWNAKVSLSDWRSAENLGAATPFALERGLNSLWTDGGLLYAPPYR